MSVLCTQSDCWTVYLCCLVKQTMYVWSSGGGCWSNRPCTCVTRPCTCGQAVVDVGQTDRVRVVKRWWVLVKQTVYVWSSGGGCWSNRPCTCGQAVVGVGQTDRVRVVKRWWVLVKQSVYVWTSGGGCCCQFATCFSHFTVITERSAYSTLSRCVGGGGMRGRGDEDRSASVCYGLGDTTVIYTAQNNLRANRIFYISSHRTVYLL